MTKSTYTELAISEADDLIFGKAPRPLSCGHGLTVGGGVVYPEINFTLPSMEVDAANMPDILTQYQSIIDGVCQRAIDLEAPGLVVEFELLPPMTEHPEWGARIVALLAKALAGYRKSHGLKSALRTTPTDIREGKRPIRRRSGPMWDAMYESFARCAQAGADLMSIESTGGKELHDEALLHCDLTGVLAALGVLGARDMAFLWEQITQACSGTNCAPAGDTACGFANTAMVLADRKMIPKVFAAVVRTAATPRSLVAYEQGAVGPSKDCAYEGPFLKAIAGVPISLEGKSAACAHLSSVGNIALATADLWSNESVQNVRLLGGDAPVVSVEQLVYDCRLMNVAAAEGPEAARQLRDWLVRSDSALDPQAYVLTPNNVIRVARAIIAAPDAFSRTRAAAGETLDLLGEGADAGTLKLNDREKKWLDLLRMQMETVPTDEQGAVEVAGLFCKENVHLAQYDLDAS